MHPPCYLFLSRSRDVIQFFVDHHHRSGYEIWVLIFNFDWVLDAGSSSFSALGMPWCTRVDPDSSNRLSTTSPRIWVSLLCCLCVPLYVICGLQNGGLCRWIYIFYFVFSPLLTLVNIFVLPFSPNKLPRYYYLVFWSYFVKISAVLTYGRP